jgi:rhodanese-related sulfurtransferase
MRENARCLPQSDVVVSFSHVRRLSFVRTEQAWGEERVGLMNRIGSAVAGPMVGLVALAASSPASGQAMPALPKGPFPSQGQLLSACSIGSGASAKGGSASDYKGSGLTPAKVAGAVTVSAREARCVIDRFPEQVLIVNAAGDTPQIKDSLDMRWAVRIAMSPQDKAELGTVLGHILKNGKSAPILVYCHHESCGLSYYVAKHIVELGYGNVLWMREGIEGWRSQGFPETSDPSKWTQPMMAASKSLLDCYGAQPVAGLDDVEVVKARIRKSCTNQMTALRNSIGGWVPTRTATATLANIDSMFDESLQSTIRTKQSGPRRQEAERKRAEEEAAFEQKWKRQQGLGVPASDLRSGFEFCHMRFVFSKEIGKDKRGRPDIAYEYTVYVSELYEAKIGKEGYDNLTGWPNYNTTQGERLTERSTAFARAVLLKKPTYSDFYSPYCHFSKTLSEAQEARNKIITENSYPKIYLSKAEWPVAASK